MCLAFLAASAASLSTRAARQHALRTSLLSSPPRAARASPPPHAARASRTRRTAAAPASAMGKQIATHNGTFHCDEVLAVHMLRRTAAYAGAPVARSRDEAVLAAADVVVDVGGVCDAASHRFDHHQRGFAQTFEGEGRRARTKLSSAGLVYKHFGREVVGAVLKEHRVEVAQADLEVVYLKVYDAFVEAVDAIDNGIAQYDTDAPPRYDNGTSLGSRVGRMNAAWNEPTTDEAQAANFAKAVAVAGAEFDDCVLQIARSWLPARSIVAGAMSARAADDADGRLLVMREWAPWKDHLFAIEAEEVAAGSPRPVQYVVYQDMTGGSWRVQAVPVDKSSFASRTPLPEPWRGARDASLSTLAGIDACVFVHASGFIGGNKTYEGAMEMARKSLAMAAAAEE
jgi:uncharacterized UPF0160 family protein